MQQTYTALPPPLPLLLSPEQISSLPSWYLPALSQSPITGVPTLQPSGTLQAQVWELSSNALGTLPKGRLPSPSEIGEASRRKDNFEYTLPSGIGAHYSTTRELPPSLIPNVPGPEKALATSIGGYLNTNAFSANQKPQSSQQYHYEQLARFIGDKTFLNTLDEDAKRRIAQTQNNFETSRFARDTRDLIMQEEIEKKALYEKCQYLNRRCYELEEQASRLIQTVDFLSSTEKPSSQGGNQNKDPAESKHQAVQGLLSLINQYKDELELVTRQNATLRQTASPNFMVTQSDHTDPMRQLLNGNLSALNNNQNTASHYLYMDSRLPSHAPQPTYYHQYQQQPPQQQQQQQAARTAFTTTINNNNDNGTPAVTSSNFMASFGSTLAAQPLQTPAV